MSYILEALKKAQAERQLGSAPTIHALAIHAAPEGGGVTRRMPLWIALGVAGALTIGAAAVFFWRQPAPAAPVVVAPAASPVDVTPPAPPRTVVVAQEPAPVGAAPAPKPARTEAPKKAAPSADPDEALMTQRELPESIQRELPALALGGYIYSKDPAERLLLIDKVLRHEGEQVAPGLTLVKLLPKSAVMDYKGYRYRMPY